MSFLAKFDPFGAMQWNRTYVDGVATSIVQVADGGFVFCCNIGNDAIYATSILLIKTNSSGNMLWNETLIQQPEGSAIAANSMAQAKDGGFAVAGYIASNNSFYSRNDFLLLKADSNGKLEWFKTYGGAGDDEANSIVQTVDGGYALAGYTSSYGPYNNNFWLVKTDWTGNLQWAKAYGTNGVGHKISGGYGQWDDYGLGDNRAYDFIQTTDAGFALIGYQGFDWGRYTWLIKTDSAGTIQWNQTYGAEGSTYSIVQTGDGGFAIATTNQTEAIHPGNQILLIKTDSSGHKQWDETFQNYELEGYPSWFETANIHPDKIIQTKDGALAIVATAGSLNASLAPYFHLMKTDPFLPALPPISSSTLPPPTEPTHLSLPTITITPDGNFTPENAPISRVGNTYTLQCNYAGSIIINKDNIVLDGSGFALQGNGSIVESDGTLTFIQFTDTGILVYNHFNVEIKNITLQAYFSSMLFNGSCNHDFVHGNVFAGDMGAGIRSLGNFSYNSIVGNTFRALDYAMLITDPNKNNVISDNGIADSGDLAIYYGLNNTFYRNNIERSGGLYLQSCTGDQIIGNRIAKSGTAIDGATAGVIAQNYLINNQIGIYETVNCQIFENNFVGNKIGIGGYSGNSYSNTIYRNNFVNNTNDTAAWEYRGPTVSLASNTWDNGTQGNYWSKYTGTDADNDGIGDIPQPIDQNNQDNRPLMNAVNVSIPPIVLPSPFITAHPSPSASVPEFPTWTALPLILVTSTIVAVAAKRRTQRPQSFS